MKMLIMCLALIMSVNIIAQSNDSVAFSREISELTVIGSIRADEKAPVTVKNLNLSQIETISFGQELPMFLNNTPSVTITSDAGSYYGYTYMRLRGIDQTRINFTLNGIPLNEPEDQGAYFNNFVDFTSSVQSMQIQRGVGTSTNGVASFAGSINFQSISLSNPIKELQLGLASYNTNRVSLQYCTGIQNNYSIYARYSDNHSDGYRYNSANDSRSFYLSGGLFYNNDILTYTGFYGFQKNQMAYLPVSIVDINKDPRTNYLSPDEWDNFKYLFNSVQYTTKRFANSVITTSLYYIKLDGNYDYLNTYSQTYDMQNYAVSSNFYGFIANINKTIYNFKLDAGIHINYYDRQHVGLDKTSDLTFYTNTGNKNEYSTFVKLSYDIDALTFYGDLQYRSIRFKYIPDATYSISVSPVQWDFLNPKLGLLYKLSENITYYASIGMTQREPNRLDMLQGYDDIDVNNYVDVGNLTNVKPEKVVDIEGGVKFNYENLKFDINGFSMEFQNEIAAIGQLSQIYGLPLRKNVPKSHRTGIETDLLLNITEDFSVENNSTFMNAVINEYKTEYDAVTYTNVTPLLTPSVISNTKLNYDMKCFNVSLIGKYVSQSYLDNENTVKLPKYFIMDFVLQIPIGNQLLDLRANNITNKRYFTGGYVDAVSVGTPDYFIQMPLNFVATLKLRF